MDSLEPHRDYLEGVWLAAQAAPLSVRKAMLVAMLVDAYVDRMFAARGEIDDILEFRAELAKRWPALGQIMALCSGKGSLTIEAVTVAIADYGRLPVEDFMVSLYNGHTVQRLRLVRPDGDREDMLPVLAAAITALDAEAQNQFTARRRARPVRP